MFIACWEDLKSKNRKQCNGNHTFWGGCRSLSISIGYEILSCSRGIRTSPNTVCLEKLSKSLTWDARRQIQESIKTFLKALTWLTWCLNFSTDKYLKMEVWSQPPSWGWYDEAPHFLAEYSWTGLQIEGCGYLLQCESATDAVLPTGQVQSLRPINTPNNS